MYGLSFTFLFLDETTQPVELTPTPVDETTQLDGATTPALSQDVTTQPVIQTGIAITRPATVATEPPDVTTGDPSTSSDTGKPNMQAQWCKEGGAVI